MKRRLFQGLLIAALLCGAVLLAHPTTAWALTGSGASDNPYQIGSAADLKEFAELVNSGATNACAKLTADITINSNVLNDDGTLNSDGNSFEPWTPIGKDNDHIYIGTFDGNDHAIYGLYIKSNAENAGLFGVIGTGGTVQNLTLADSYINNSASLCYAGSICGYNSGGTITGCSNSCSVSGSGINVYVGGICGRNWDKGSISDCSNSGTVTGNGNGAYVGGICGRNWDKGSISDCSNSGSVSGNGNIAYVGGICGWNVDGSISDCSNSGSVSGNGNVAYVGGICGRNNSGGSISNCYWLDSCGASAGVGSSSGTIEKVKEKTPDEFASGEVAWLLNQGRTDGPWRQTLGTDNFPVLDSAHKIVYWTAFYANTGKEEENIICYGNANASVAVPEKPIGSPDTVCIFDGWYGSKNFAESDKLTDKNVTVTSDKEYWAKWTANVTLHTNGGTIADGENLTSYTYGVGVTLPTDVTRAGYTFGGWYENEDCTGAKVTAITATDIGDKKYWAKWTEATYSVTLNTNNGTIADGKDVTGYTYGTESTLPTAQDITRTGYTFEGWYENETCTGDKVTAIPADAIGEKTYWAKWTEATYSVTLNTNNGTIADGKDVTGYTYGTESTLPTAQDITRTGYTFAGWYEDADFTGEPVTTITASDTGDKEYWAKWTAVPSGPSTYQIVLDSDITGGTVTASPRWAARGDTVYLTVTADEGYELSTLSVSDRNGNAITLDNEGGGVYSFTMPIGRVTVTATFDKAVITLPFTDVNADDWFYDPVCFVYENGLMTGTSADTFEPNTSLSRAMLVAVLHRLEGSPAASGSDFNDVASGDWYAEAVNWAASVGVVNGMGDGTFQPNAAITREQMAAILRNYAQYKGMDVTTSGDLSTYSDAASVSSWAQESVAWAVNQGLLSGMTIDTLQPQGLSTRAQVAAVLQRALGNVAGNQ